MVRYNRARRAEWVEAQKKLEDNELAMARLAYIKGEATEDQILLVEEANRAAEAKGEKLPPLLAAPEHRTHFEEHIKPTFQDKTEEIVAKPTSGKGVMGVFSGVLGSGDSKEQSTNGTSREGQEQLVQLETARSENGQLVGGPLDRLGVEPTGSSTTSKSWWKFW